VDTRWREDEGDVARGETDAGAERGSECAGPGQERRERDGRAGAGVDERRAGRRGQRVGEEGQREGREGEREVRRR